MNPQQNPPANPPQIPPIGDVKVAVSLHKGYCLYEGRATIEQLMPVVDKGLTVHGVHGDNGIELDDPPNPLVVSLDDVAALAPIAPTFLAGGRTSHTAADVRLRLSSALTRHLRYVPFLSANTYWPFARRAYYDHALQGFLGYLFVNSTEPPVPPKLGMWGIYAAELINLADAYAHGGCVKSFYVFWYPLSHCWVLRELALPYTNEGLPARFTFRITPFVADNTIIWIVA